MDEILNTHFFMQYFTSIIRTKNLFFKLSKWGCLLFFLMLNILKTVFKKMLNIISCYLNTYPEV